MNTTTYMNTGFGYGYQCDCDHDHRDDARLAAVASRAPFQESGGGGGSGSQTELHTESHPSPILNSISNPNANPNAKLNPNANTKRSSWRTWAGPATKNTNMYCHHDRTGSAGSTEYWVWTGLGGADESESETGETTTTTTGDPPITVSSPIQDTSRTGTSMSDTSFSFSSSLSLSFGGGDEGDEDGSSLIADLPSESFTPLLLSNRQLLDASRGRTTSTAGSQSQLFGLGIYGLTGRDEKKSSAFDGLGVVRVHSHSSPWRSGNGGGGCVYGAVEGEEEGDDMKLTETFLQELEAFFLFKNDLAFSAGVAPALAPLVQIERVWFDDDADGCETGSDLATPRVETTALSLRDGEWVPRKERDIEEVSSMTRAMVPAGLAGRVKRALSGHRRNLSVSPAPALASASLSMGTPLPMSMTASSSSSSFVRRTCSACHSGSNLNLAAQHKTPVTRMLPSVSSRNIGIGISISSSNSNNSHICSHKKICTPLSSFQSGSVRDLSSVGTISSDLKKRCKSVVGLAPTTTTTATTAMTTATTRESSSSKFLGLQ
ncbi:hypothetical protein AX17_007527 [Amanita inopinata Kibby_2008]|nr:hypothetical protein AX17_007527 [Amanita inopinata Kibby_2008]